MLRLSLCILLLPAAATVAHDNVPGPVENVAIVGGTVHTVSGETIDKGIVITADGVITDVLGDVELYTLPEGTLVIDASGKHVYPGLIDASAEVGLVEVNAVRASRDLDEAGNVSPEAKAQLAFNPDSEHVATTRANGVLLVHSHPEGGIVSGTGAVMRLEGWTYEDMTLASTGLVLNWPGLLPNTAWWNDETPEEQAKERDENLARIETIFDQARQYRRAKAADDTIAYDASMEAMMPALAGEAKVFVNADEASQIESAVAFGVRRGLDLVIIGGRDAALVSDLLIEHDVPVIIDGIQRLPDRRDDDVAAVYALPAALKQAGVTFAISADRGAAFTRNLPYHAASAVGYGLSAEDAVASLTLWPAKILGVADKVGSLGQGKEATLFIADGDILEVTSHVTDAWVNGRRVDLSSHHTRLRDKYRARLAE